MTTAEMYTSYNICLVCHRKLNSDKICMHCLTKAIKSAIIGELKHASEKHSSTNSNHRRTR